MFWSLSEAGRLPTDDSLRTRLSEASRFPTVRKGFLMFWPLCSDPLSDGKISEASRSPTPYVLASVKLATFRPWRNDP